MNLITDVARVLGPFVGLACFIGGLSNAGPAKAGTFDTARVGSWTSFAGTTKQGLPLCGMTTGNSNTGATLQIKYFAGDGGALTVQASKPGWRFAAGTETRADVWFDSGWAGGTDHAKTQTASFGGVVWFTVPADKAAGFLADFAEADHMRLNMGGVTWTADMTGSRAIAGAFGNCLRPLLAAEAQTPSARAPETQPQPQTKPAPLPTPRPAGRKPGESDA
jgi:hypothetical protein